MQLRKKPLRSGEKPSYAQTRSAYAVAAEEASIDEGSVIPIPLVWVSRVNLTKLRQEMADLKL
jgi:hypothetical protein